MTGAGSSGIGFLLGLRHALEPDHLLAVTALLERPLASCALRASGLWGLGHAGVLFALGAASFAFRRPLSPLEQTAFEGLACLLLMFLGGRALVGLSAGKHEHAAPAAPAGWKPLSLGMVHGLSGSGAVVLLLMASTATWGDGATYMAAFGAGSVLGMVATIASLGFAAQVLRRRLGHSDAAAQAAQAARVTVGFASLFLGGYLLWDLLA